MKKKTGIMILVLLLAVGFAAVSATFIISGNTGFTTNDDEFEVIFTKAIIDDVEDNSVISADGKSISYTTKELSFIDDYSKLDFTVKNNSTQYDAEVSIECVGGSNAGTYYEITKSFTSSIPAQTEVEGNVTVTMIRSSVNDIEETFTCTIKGNAIERDTAAEPVSKTQITYSDEDSSGTKNIGDIVTISKDGASSESFYILSDDGTNLQMMSMYNLYVGYECTEDATSSCTAYENSTGIQDSTMIGWNSSGTPYKGPTKFSSDGVVEYEGSVVEGYVNSYSTYLSNTLGVENTSTIISKEELETIVASTLSYGDELSTLGVPTFLYSTSYWIRSAYSTDSVFGVNSDGKIERAYSYSAFVFGVRPIITISSSLIE